MPRKALKRTRRRTAKPKFPHAFFSMRGITDAYTVVRIDDYMTDPHTGPNGQSYRPSLEDYKRGNTIWPTREQAEHAAKWAVGKWPTRVYGVYHMVAIVEAYHVEPTTKTTEL